MLQLRRQLVHQVRQPTHLFHLRQLRLEVVQVELAADLDFLRQVLRCCDIDTFLGFLHQRKNIAHAENPVRHPGRIERFQPIQFFRDTGELDWLASDVAHRQRRTAARIAIQLGQHDTGQRQRVVEGLGGVDRVLAQHRIDHE